MTLEATTSVHPDSITPVKADLALSPEKEAAALKAKKPLPPDLIHQHNGLQVEVELIRSKKKAEDLAGEAEKKQKEKVQKKLEKPGSKDTDPALASDEPPSRKERFKQIMDKVKDADYRLDKDARTKLETLVKDVVSGPSKLESVLEAKIMKAAEELNSVASPEKLSEVTELNSGIESINGNLSGEDRAKVESMLAFRKMFQGQAKFFGFDPKQATAEIDKDIEALAPGLVSKVDRIQELVTPALDKIAELTALSNRIKEEREQSTTILTNYAWALHLMGDGNADDKRARELLREASKRNQELLDDEHFQDLARRLNIDSADLLMREVAH